jgi:hypothetical protein
MDSRLSHREIKLATLAPSRAPAVVGSKQVSRTVAGHAKRAKPAKATNVAMTGGSVRLRLDRPARKSGGRVKRADGGLLPGTDIPFPVTGVNQPGYVPRPGVNDPLTSIAAAARRGAVSFARRPAPAPDAVPIVAGNPYLSVPQRADGGVAAFVPQGLDVSLQDNPYFARPKLSGTYNLPGGSGVSINGNFQPLGTSVSPRQPADWGIRGTFRREF